VSTPLPPTLQQLLQRPIALTPVVDVTLRYGTSTQEIAVSSGTVTLDRRRRQRGTVNLNVLVRGAIPAALTPLGGALDVSLGVRSITGAEAVVPLLTNAVITSVSGLEVDNSVISVQATESSERVARWRFEQPFTTPANVTLAEVVNAVLSNRGMPTALAPAGPTLTVARVFGLDAAKDPWVELCELCDALGWRLWLSRSGVPRLDQPQPAGTARAVQVLQPQVSSSSRPVNVVVGRWEPTDGSAPVRAQAEDQDPASPTFVGGPYGRVTGYFASSLPITQAAANQAVQTILARERYQGAGRTWTTPWDPTFDPDDVVSAANFPALPTTVVEAVTVDLGNATTKLEVSEVPT